MADAPLGTTTLAYTNHREQTTSINPFGAGAQTLSYRGATGQNDPTQIGNQPGGGGAPALQENGLGISAQEPSSSSGPTPSSADTYYTRAPDGELLAERGSGGATSTADYYYVQDANDSVVALTNSSDTVANTYTYDPYGTVTPGSSNTAPNSFGFDGGYNAQSGLILFGTRYYNPATATWTQPDPAAQSLATDPTQADAYGFAGNDPSNYTDPTGDGKTKDKAKKAAQGLRQKGLATGAAIIIGTGGGHPDDGPPAIVPPPIRPETTGQKFYSVPDTSPSRRSMAYTVFGGRRPAT
jgi:RHS repeat-associated protein